MRAGGYGQRPSVILRGQNGSVSTVYLVRFDRSIFTGGGVQYQQTMDNPGGAAAGWFDFVSCVLEWSGSPLLDLQSASFKGYFPGLSQVVIRDYVSPPSCHTQNACCIMHALSWVAQSYGCATYNRWPPTKSSSHASVSANRPSLL